MQKTLQTYKDTTEKKQVSLLKKLVDRRRKILMGLTEKMEQLRLELSEIATSYVQRIGHLYRKDNLLDLEIIRVKKINELMDVGVSYEEAIMKIKDYAKEERETFEKEEEEYIAMQKEEDVDEDLLLRIQKLWKKLVHKFHPDLTSDVEEKKRCEEMMKHINKAYKEHDLQTLQAVQDKELVEQHPAADGKKLEQVLVDMENAILRVKATLQELRKDIWYNWIKKTRKEKEELFAEMEGKLHDDILTKEILLRQLKRKHNL